MTPPGPTSTMGSDPTKETGPMTAGRRRSGASVKTLKRVLKKAGLKVSGKKATLTRRAKKAHLKLKGGADPEGAEGEEGVVAGRRRRGSRKSRGFRLY